MRRGPNRRALDRTLRGMDLPRAVVQMLRSLADAVDAEPKKAALWREYREALREALVQKEEADAAATLAELRSVPAVGNAADGPAE